jgi:site-specific recombinase XerC
LQGWFDQQKFSRSNYMHWRRVLNIFFQYCVARGHTLANPVQAVEIFTVERAKVAIYTPEQMRKMIKASDPDFRLFLLFGGFAGLRPSEVYEEATDDARLDWQEVDFKAGYIVVTDENKTGERLVPILPNLREWLTPLAQKKGKVFGRAMTLGALRRRMIKKSGVPWIQDGLRHSWISYRLAELGDVNRVAGEAGNSPKIIKQNYKAIRTPDKQLVTPALAREWFGIMPEKTGS